MQQHAIVIGGDHPEAAECPAVNHGVRIERPQFAVAAQADFHGQMRGVATVVGEENFLPGESDADGLPGFVCNMCDNQFMRKRVALPAEPAADGRFYHPDLAEWHTEHPA